MQTISRFQLSVPLFSWVLTFGIIFSAPAAEKITFDDHIFPILESSCLNCHNPDKKKGGLDLSTYQGALSGGSGGKIAITGEGASSRIYNVINHTEEPVMPPKGDKLAKKEADLLRAWIDGGLLETKSSKARRPKKPAFSLSPTTNPQSKPEGPLPMPRDLLLEPAVITERATVVNDMEASPWAPLLAVTGQRQILLYHTESLKLVGILPFPYGTPETVSFHPGGKYLLAGGGIGGKSGTTVTWDVTTGNVLMTMGKEFDSVLAASLRADLGAVAMGGPSRLIKFWDPQLSEQTLKIKKHTDWVISLAYSPDGVLLATGDRNNGIQIWEAITGNEFHSLRGHQKSIVDLKWRADSNIIASASADGDLAFWDMNQGKQIKKQRAHDAGILAMDYARDGQLISSGRDKRVKIWKSDLALKKELPPFSAEITEVEFSHDSKRFFTADWDGKIQVWENDSYKQIGTLEANPPTIATRLTHFNPQTAMLAKEIADTRLEVPKKEAAHQKARNWLTSLKKRIPELKQIIPKLQKELGQQNVLWNQFETKEKQLHAQIQQHEKELQQRHETVHTLSKEREKIVPELNEARKQKNEALVKQFDQRIKDQNNKIKEGRDDMDSRTIAIRKLREAHEIATVKRNEAGELKKKKEEELEKLQPELSKREKELETAKKGLEGDVKELEETREKLAVAEKADGNHQAKIKHWKAAQINTELIKAKGNLKELMESLSLLQLDLQVAAKEENTEAVQALKLKIDKASETKEREDSSVSVLQARYEAAK